MTPYKISPNEKSLASLINYARAKGRNATHRSLKSHFGSRVKAHLVSRD